MKLRAGFLILMAVSRWRWHGTVFRHEYRRERDRRLEAKRMGYGINKQMIYYDYEMKWIDNRRI